MFMHLTWQSVLFVRSQESVVDNTILGAINGESKPVVYHPQAICGLESMSKKEKEQLHDVSLENGLLANLCKTFFILWGAHLKRRSGLWDQLYFHSTP